MSVIDLKREVDKRLKNKFGRKHKRDAKLHELEKQLQFAESRCGTLKQQLDYIKLLYGYRKCPEFQYQESLYETSGQGGGDNVNYLNLKEPIKWSKPFERNNNREESDNRDFTNQKGSQSNTTFTNSNSSNKKNWTKEEDRLRTRQKGHIKLQKVKKKYPRKIRKKRKTDDASSSKFSNASSQTLSQILQDPVVEIYKNAVVNAESESGLDMFGSNLKRIQKISEIMLDIKKGTGIKDGKVSEKNVTEEEGFKAKKSNFHAEKNFSKSKDAGYFKEEGIQTEISIEVMASKVNFESGKEFPVKDSHPVVKPEHEFIEPVKNYCQPTISSKRKQVERDVYSSLNSVNIRNIPFIAAKSTTPSHNIGINIQQVLSIMKKRHHSGNEPFINSNESSTGCNDNNCSSNTFNSKKAGHDSEKVSECNAPPSSSSCSKKRPEGIIKSDLSHWISNSDFGKEKSNNSKIKNSDLVDSGLEWTLKVDKLKRVLVFLHEDFASLSHKYKRLQKKLTKRNISKADAKGELGEIEKDLEKKEEEITVVIGLYREVLSLKENLKKLQEKYNVVSCSKAFAFDGLKQSYSAHTQMTTLLRKIQNFQDQLKG